MRIGIDFRPAMFSNTGFGRYVLELARALGKLEGVEREHEIKLFGDALRGFRHEGRCREVIAGSHAKLYRMRFPGRLLLWLSKLGYSVESRLDGIDVFHYTDFVYPPVLRAPIVATIHDLSFEVDTAFHGPAFRASVRPRVERSLAKAARVIVPGVETKARLAQHYGFDPARVDVVPYGCEHLQRVQPDRAAANGWLAAQRIRAPFALCVGTIEPRKNHARLLRAFARVASEIPHHLVIAGSFGWLYDEVKTELTRLASSGRVHVVEKASDELLRALYDQAEYAVYPSLYEGFGFPAVEALALGVPLITTRGGSLGEVVADAAEFCDPLDEDSIAAALRNVATQPERRAALRERGLRRAAELSWKRCAEGHLAVYSAAARD